MYDTTEPFRPAQPIGEAARSILYKIIVNAETKADQKAFVLTGYESGYFSVAETFAWFAVLGLAAA